METGFLQLLLSTGASMGVTWFANKAGPLETLNSLWYLGFGAIDEKAKDKKHSSQLKREQIYQQATIQATAEELANIPAEYIQEPRENIAKPAIEAIKLYNSEESLRRMFAKILASSMDSRHNNKSHQSFIEIMKNLSPIDAENLAVVSNMENRAPIVNIILNSENNAGTFFKITSNLFISNPKMLDSSIQSVSIENLERLGLVEIDYTSNLKSPHYEPFKNTSDYQVAVSIVSDHAKVLENLTPGEPSEDYFRSLEMQGGIVRLTNYGKSFCTICL